MASLPMQLIKSLIRGVDLEGQSFIPTNSIMNDQLLTLFGLGHNLGLQNRGNWQLYPNAIVLLLFFQPLTHIRMSFGAAMHRMGGNVTTGNTPQTTSSIIKEEPLADMLRCASQYANVIMLRHPNDVGTREGASYSLAPVTNGGCGHWEHPTQALFDLYTLWCKFGHIEGLKVTVAAMDMIEACTGHSMAQGLARLGAEVIIASPRDKAVPREVVENIKKNYPNAKLEGAYDSEKDSFNEFIRDKDPVYLPGCSTLAGTTAEAFKKMTDGYFVKHEMLDEEREKGHMIYVTHMLPRRADEMDLAINDTLNQPCFESILRSVSIRMTLLIMVLGT